MIRIWTFEFKLSIGELNLTFWVAIIYQLIIGTTERAKNGHNFKLKYNVNFLIS